MPSCMPLAPHSSPSDPMGDASFDHTPCQVAPTWLVGPFAWKFCGFAGWPWLFLARALQQGRTSNDSSSNESPKFSKSLRSPPLLFVSGWLAWLRSVPHSVAQLPSSSATVSLPISTPAVTIPEDCQNDICRNVPPVSASSEGHHQSHSLGPPQKPMLPTEALHRAASDAAQAIQLSSGRTCNRPSLFLPAAALAGVPTPATDPGNPIAPEMPQQRNTAKVSFFEHAEWIWFDADESVLKTLHIPLRDIGGGESPRSPESSEIKSSMLRFDLHAATVATPRPGPSDSHEVSFCNAVKDSTIPHVQLSALVPDSLNFCDGESVGASAGKGPAESSTLQIPVTPRASAARTESFHFCEVAQDAATPASRCSASLQFGFGIDSLSDSEGPPIIMC